MENTNIQWTDATVKFWTGCNKVSAGCKFCYMSRDKERYGKNPAIEETETEEKLVYLINHGAVSMLMRPNKNKNNE